MRPRPRFAMVLAVLLAAGLVSNVSAGYSRSGLPGDPPRPLLPGASRPTQVPPPAGKGLVHPTRRRFYHDHDVLVFGLSTTLLAGACALFRRHRSNAV